MRDYTYSYGIIMLCNQDDIDIVNIKYLRTLFNFIYTSGYLKCEVDDTEELTHSYIQSYTIYSTI